MVRLPAEFRFEGWEVEIRLRSGDGGGGAFEAHEIMG